MSAPEEPPQNTFHPKVNTNQQYRGILTPAISAILHPHKIYTAKPEMDLDTEAQSENLQKIEKHDEELKGNKDPDVKLAKPEMDWDKEAQYDNLQKREKHDEELKGNKDPDVRDEKFEEFVPGKQLPDKIQHPEESQRLGPDKDALLKGTPLEKNQAGENSKENEKQNVKQDQQQHTNQAEPQQEERPSPNTPEPQQPQQHQQDSDQNSSNTSSPSFIEMISGVKDVAMGSIKQGTGYLIGNEDLEHRGIQQKETGKEGWSGQSSQPPTAI